MPTSSRKQFPATVVTAVLTASRRRCALCYGLDGDTTEKEGQIAHVDRDASNALESNAAWLCTRHHARYDTRSRQTKGHMPNELIAYRTMLHEQMASPAAWPDAGAGRTHGSGVSLEVFDRRIPVYRATLAFLREVIKGTKLDLETLFAFARDTDEALFLFDDALSEYLRELYRRAVQLRATYSMRQEPDHKTADLSKQWSEAMLWFSEQFDEVRRRFAPYLRVSGGLAHQPLQPAVAGRTKRPPQQNRVR
jgi:hypothetical protein